MARPERKDADYFPFYAKDGRTLFILEDKYGCKGTGFFTNVLRFLTLQPDHHFCIKNEADKLYFFSKTKCDEVSGMDMLNIMTKTCKIHSDLWVTYEVIVSEDLLTSLKDAYRNRINSIITIDEIVVFYAGNSQEEGVSDTGKPQRKLKESKVKKEGKFLPPSSDELKDYCRKRQNQINPETFIDFYTAKGWMVGKNKMKDWKAAVRTWEQRDTGAKHEDPYAKSL